MIVAGLLGEGEEEAGVAVLGEVGASAESERLQLVGACSVLFLNVVQQLRLPSQQVSSRLQLLDHLVC